MAGYPDVRNYVEYVKLSSHPIPHPTSQNKTIRSLKQYLSPVITTAHHSTQHIYPLTPILSLRRPPSNPTPSQTPKVQTSPDLPKLQLHRPKKSGELTPSKPIHPYTSPNNPQAPAPPLFSPIPPRNSIYLTPDAKLKPTTPNPNNPTKPPPSLPSLTNLNLKLKSPLIDTKSHPPLPAHPRLPAQLPDSRSGVRLSSLKIVDLSGSLAAWRMERNLG